MTNSSSKASSGVQFKINGDRQIARDLDTKEFREALTELLIEAGYPAYEGTVVPGSGIAASSQTKGFAIGTPLRNQNAVELKWQLRSRINLCLSVPPEEDKFRFHASLKSALSRLQIR